MGNDPAQSQYTSDTMQNVQNPSMMFMMYSAVFGNMAFQVQPSSKGQVQDGFNSVPYLSLEALLYNGAMSNPIVAPSNIQTGSTAGTQNIQGGQTVTDTSGNIRIAMGTTGGF